MQYGTEKRPGYIMEHSPKDYVIPKPSEVKKSGWLDFVVQLLGVFFGLLLAQLTFNG